MDSCGKSSIEVSTGVDQLDSLIGHLSLGDNVIWYDSSGDQAWPFSMRFMESSSDRIGPILYVAFDISPRDLLSRLEPLEIGSQLKILDCFTWGRGQGAELYRNFYHEDRAKHPGRIIMIDRPSLASLVSEALWETFDTLEGDVRLVFDSLTGMQGLWKAEKKTLAFYSATCPRLYDLGTLSYWIVKGESLSPATRNQLNEIAQVVIDLNVRRGKEFLSPVKTGENGIPNVGREHSYSIDGDDHVVFPGKWQLVNEIDLPQRMKEARRIRGMSQKELARRVGVTGSTISQAESNMILPSLHTLLKIAEVLSVEPSYLLRKKARPREELVLSPSKGKEVCLPLLRSGSAVVRNVTPLGAKYNTDIYLVEIPAGKRLRNHFLIHKGEEIGCLLSGSLEFTLDQRQYRVEQGEIVYLTSDVPGEWTNVGETAAKLLWIAMK